MTELDASIAAWRTAITRGPAVTEADAEELESHLREQLEELTDAGLSPDEALQIALQRLGRTDQLTAEYAREHSDRLWKQFVLPAPSEKPHSGTLLTMIVFALAAAAIIQTARLIAGIPYAMEPWFYRSLPLLVIPVLAAYFAFTRRLPLRHWAIGAGVVAALAVAINLFPFETMNSQTEVLAVLHLPVLLWCLAGAAYLAGGARLMDFVRFSGEWAIYFVLLCLGGGVLLGLTSALLLPLVTGQVLSEVMLWVMPSGGTAAVIVAAWLVEAKKSLIESVAPVLAAIFTPLFAVMLAVASVVYLVAGIGVDFDRDLLMVFDGMLIVVLALVLYGIAARTPGKPAGALDVMRLIAVAAALLLDLLVLGSMLARVAEFGFTPNRIAALGLNVLLVLSLAGTAWLLLRMLWQRRDASGLERWQLRSLPVFAAWAGVVVLALPPLFGFA